MHCTSIPQTFTSKKCIILLKKGQFLSKIWIFVSLKMLYKLSQTITAGKKSVVNLSANANILKPTLTSGRETVNADIY